MEKFNEKLKFFLPLILMLSALKYLCSGGLVPWFSPMELLLYMLLQKFRGRARRMIIYIFKLGGNAPCHTSSGPHAVHLSHIVVPLVLTSTRAGRAAWRSLHCRSAVALWTVLYIHCYSKFLWQLLWQTSLTAPPWTLGGKMGLGKAGTV